MIIYTFKYRICEANEKATKVFRIILQTFLDYYLKKKEPALNNMPYVLCKTKHNYQCHKSPLSGSFVTP